MTASPPPQRQRLAAYAVLRQSGQILLAQVASRIHADLWTLPGGGVDHGEHPREAATREVYEESGLHVRVGRLLDVHSRHFTGARPDGRVEDFHGVGLIFSAAVLPVSEGVEPHVVEVDGTTRAVGWFDLRTVASLSLSSTANHVLEILNEVSS